MERVVLWTLVIILMTGFVVYYGYVIGVTVRDILERLGILKSVVIEDDSTYGVERDPTGGRGSDRYGRRG